MNRFSNLFIKHLRNLHLSFAIVLLGIIFIGQNSFVSHLDEVVFAIFHSPFSNLKQTYFDFSNVSEENERLSQILIETSVKLAFMEEAELENERLRSVLGFQPPPSYTLLPAEVISVVGDYIPMAVVINRGLNDSLAIDMPVINQLGLIGRITEVSNGTSVVQLLTDPTSRVAARVVESREMGIVKYHGSRGMILDNFPIQGKINIGDQIISSGLGGVYPSGLYVGQVTEVEKVELQPFYDVKVKPAANFYSIEELFILRVENQ
jgi:rod shape-determining protein MreC